MLDNSSNVVENEPTIISNSNKKGFNESDRNFKFQEVYSSSHSHKKIEKNINNKLNNTHVNSIVSTEYYDIQFSRKEELNSPYLELSDYVGNFISKTELQPLIIRNYGLVSGLSQLKGYTFFGVLGYQRTQNLNRREVAQIIDIPINLDVDDNLLLKNNNTNKQVFSIFFNKDLNSFMIKSLVQNEEKQESISSNSSNTLSTKIQSKTETLHIRNKPELSKFSLEKVSLISKFLSYFQMKINLFMKLTPSHSPLFNKNEDTDELNISYLLIKIGDYLLRVRIIDNNVNTDDKNNDNSERYFSNLPSSLKSETNESSGPKDTLEIVVIGELGNKTIINSNELNKLSINQLSYLKYGFNFSTNKNEKNLVTIGHSSKCDIVLNNKNISEFHCFFKYNCIYEFWELFDGSPFNSNEHSLDGTWIFLDPQIEYKLTSFDDESDFLKVGKKVVQIKTKKPF